MKNETNSIKWCILVKMDNFSYFHAFNPFRPPRRGSRGRYGRWHVVGGERGMDVKGGGGVRATEMRARSVREARASFARALRLEQFVSPRSHLID